MPSSGSLATRDIPLTLGAELLEAISACPDAKLALRLLYSGQTREDFAKGKPGVSPDYLGVCIVAMTDIVLEVTGLRMSVGRARARSLASDPSEEA